jgi:uncharacterized OB-fold protein
MTKKRNPSNLIARHEPKVCVRCGAVFVPASSIAKYCPSCRPLAYKEYRKGGISCLKR